jgi:hypothetical protein
MITVIKDNQKLIQDSPCEFRDKEIASAVESILKKEGIVHYDGKNVRATTLHITYGHNEYTTSINLIDKAGYMVAYFLNGIWFHSWSKSTCEIE